MKHKMKLWSKPFNMIRSGQKTYELRLYDEKRHMVQVNDEIEFSCLDGNESPIVVQVIALHLFKNFGELYAALPLLKCGYTNLGNPLRPIVLSLQKSSGNSRFKKSYRKT